MVGSQWWVPQIPEELWPGDIFANIAFIGSEHPRVPLKPGPSAPGGVQTLIRSGVQPEPGHRGPWLAMGATYFGMLLNHGCDLDKPKKTSKCLLVIAQPLATYEQNLHEVITAQRSIPLMFLPGVPGQGDLVADFRHVVTVPRATIDEASRIATMTEEAQLRMQTQLVKFFTRREFDNVVSGAAKAADFAQPAKG